MDRDLSVFGEIISDIEKADFIRLINLTREIFKQEFKTLEIMPGGLTNKNFKVVTEDGTPVAVRLAGQGTADYINRPAEKYNAVEMAAIGISPEIYYYDAKVGSQIVEFINKETMHAIDFQTKDDVLEKAGKVMRFYHDSGVKFKSAFSPIVVTEGYIEILKKSYDKRYEGWDRISSALDKIKSIYAVNPPVQVPCHNDTLAENFMYDGKAMSVIDWEYSGMNDGFYDLACVVVENSLDQKCEEKILCAYCGGEPTEIDRAKLLINKFLVTTHWSTWSLVQISYGKDEAFYWDYGLERAVQACGFLDYPKFSQYLDIIAKK